MSWRSDLNVSYNNGYPHLVNNLFSHNHSALTAICLDQADKLQECIRALEKHVAENVGSRQEAFKAEVAADKKRLEQVNDGLYQIELAKRTSASTIEKIEEVVQRTVAAAMKQHTAELTKLVSQVVEQKVQSAMAKLLPEVKEAVAEEVAHGLMEKLTQEAKSLDIDDDD